MKPQEIQEIFQKIKEQQPLIHMIPNTVSAALCADGLSALGARPLMAVAAEEMEEMVTQADGVVVNLGQLTKEKQEAAALALEAAGKMRRPVVLDPVGCGASRFRLDTVNKLLGLSWQGILKGNVSELYSIQNQELTREGIDAVAERILVNAASSGRVWLATGTADRIYTLEGETILPPKNSRKYNMVGTGCLLGAVAGACHSVEPDGRRAALAAAQGMAFVLEQTGRTEGYGSGKTKLLDALGRITDTVFLVWMKEKKAERTAVSADR